MVPRQQFPEPEGSVISTPAGEICPLDEPRPGSPYWNPPTPSWNHRHTLFPGRQVLWGVSSLLFLFACSPLFISLFLSVLVFLVFALDLFLFFLSLFVSSVFCFSLSLSLLCYFLSLLLLLLFLSLRLFRCFGLSLSALIVSCLLWICFLLS